jgi:hypothetical protein
MARNTTKTTKTTARKAKEERKVAAIGEVLSKTATFDAVAEMANEALGENLALNRKQVAAAIAAYHDVVVGQVMPGGAGKAKMPGFAVLVARKIKAKKGGQKVVSFGVERVTKDKPATVRLRMKPTTALKRAVIPPKLLAVLDEQKATARRKAAKARAAAGTTKAKPGKKVIKKKRVA